MITKRMFCVKDFNSGRIWSLHPRTAAHPEEHKDVVLRSGQIYIMTSMMSVDTRQK